MNGKGLKKWPVLFIRQLTHTPLLIATFAFVDSNSKSTKVHLYNRVPRVFCFCVNLLK